MKFKQWLEDNDWSAGSLQTFPGSNLNTNLPVQSRISCKDGSDKITPDGTEGKVRPEKLFGFRTPSAKKASDKRSAEYINTNSRRVPVTTIPPDNT